MMSLAKAVPDGLKDCKCKKIAFCECPLIPYVPKKDWIHKTVSAFKDNHLKMQIGKDKELGAPIWYFGTREAFLIHAGSSQRAIMRKGYFKVFVESN
jgi:hypothetical protein